jgi:hypothetical protein
MTNLGTLSLSKHHYSLEDRECETPRDAHLFFRRASMSPAPFLPVDGPQDACTAFMLMVDMMEGALHAREEEKKAKEGKRFHGYSFFTKGPRCYESSY